MTPTHTTLFITALATHFATQTAFAAEQVEIVTCYQNGTQIVRTQGRVREFLPADTMPLLADIKLGQASEAHQKLYANAVGNIVCVVTTAK